LRKSSGVLSRLNAEEGALYDQLRGNHWGDRIRLEQERIAFDYLGDRLRRSREGEEAV